MTTKHQSAENILDQTMTIEGSVSYTGTAVVEGSIMGNVTGDTIILTETGRIVGDLTMKKKVDCRGYIRGAITTESIIIGPAATIDGQIVSPTVEIKPGSNIQCRINKGIVADYNNPDEPATAEVSTVKEEVSLPKDVDIESPQPTQKPAPASQSISIAPISKEPIMAIDYFTGANREHICRSIVEEFKSSKQMVKVIGDLGSGKTTICQQVCDRLADSHKIIRLENVVGSIKDILLRIAEALDFQIDRKLNQREIMAKFEVYLADTAQGDQVTALILDNSQEMYPATLEGVVKNLSYAYSNNGKLIQIMLLGDDFLDKHLDPRVTDYFQDHPECVFKLKPLSDNETRNYIRFKLDLIQRCSNSDKPIEFPNDSMAKVYSFSRGIIGKIDKIVENAIELAGNKKSASVAAKFVKNI